VTAEDFGLTALLIDFGSTYTSLNAVTRIQGVESLNF
jgi:hypothetical protein